MGMKLIKRGAEAKVYADELFDKRIIIKRREAKRYRVKALDENLRKARTKSEARVILRAMDAVRVPAVFYVGEYEIWMEFLPGELLRETSIRKKQYATIGQLLAELHRIGIAHGDFTPANIIVDGKRFSIIDFGLSSFSKDVEEQAIDVLLMQKSIKKDYYKLFLQGYKHYKNWQRVLRRAEEIKKRGRYWERKEEA